MDDNEDRYDPAQGFESSHNSKLPPQNASYPRNVGDQYEEGDDDTEVDEEGEGGDGNEEYSIELNGKAENVNDEDDVLDEDEDSDDDDGTDDDNIENNYSRRIESGDQNRQPKKRKMKSLLSSYEFAPRVSAPLATISSASKSSKSSHGGRNALSDWTENETYVLLDAWGNRFLQRGRKSLRSEEWQEVAEKVSQGSKLERTDTQCRNRLDTLKKKYKKEKMKLQEMGGTTSKWVYFKKMDMLLSSIPQQRSLLRGVNSVNSREDVVRNPRVSVNRACEIDDMRNSTENSESVDAEETASDVLPTKRAKRCDGASFRLLAESITKFSDIYEKIESTKRKQMLELEKIRMDFLRELEMQKRHILERARAEIADIWRENGQRNDGSAQNSSG